MFLPDDDGAIVEVDNIPFEIKKRTYLHLHPVCKFFIPKTGVNIFENVSCRSLNIVEEIINPKQTLTTDLDIEIEHDYEAQNSHPNHFNDHIVKEESSIKIENSILSFPYPLSPTESSSFSALPNLGSICSKSTKSLSDMDHQEPNSSVQMPLIVMDVYSLNNVHKSDSIEMDKDDFIPLGTCIKSCDNAIKITRKLLSNDQTYPKNKLSDQNTGKSIRQTNEIFQLTGQRKPKFVGGTGDSQSNNVDNFTGGMTDSSFYNAMQPIVLVEPLKLDQIISRKRCRTSDRIAFDSQPPEKKSRKSSSMSRKSNPVTRTRKSVKQNALSIENKSSVKTEQTIADPHKSPIRHARPNQTGVTYHSMTTVFANDFPHCVPCDKRGPCTLHPIKWIVNDNVFCPFVEYLTDNTHEKYFQPKSQIKPCNCNQSELEHIQTGLPKQFQLRESSKSEIGIWTTARLEPGTLIGPYLGEIVIHQPVDRSKFNHYKTRGFSKSQFCDELSIFQYAFKSNWLRCVHFTNNHDQANLITFRHDNKLFFKVTKVIHANVELFVCDNPDVRSTNSNKRRKDSSNYRPIRQVTEPPSVHLTEDADHLDRNKYSTEIDKIWKESDQKTVAEVLDMFQVKLKKENTIAEDYLCPIPQKFRLRNGRHDNEIITYIKEIFHSSPDVDTYEINLMIQEKFPQKPLLNDEDVNLIISRHKLRPLRGMDDKVEQEMVEAIVEIFNSNPQLMLKTGQEMLKKRFPLRPIPDIETINRIVKMNYCRLTVDRATQSADQELVHEMRQVIDTHPNISNNHLVNILKSCFPNKDNITLKSVGVLASRFHLRRKKLDEQMKAVIWKLHLDNPAFIISKINYQLRILLPEKPFVTNDVVSSAIRNMRIANCLDS